MVAGGTTGGRISWRAADEGVASPDPVLLRLMMGLPVLRLTMGMPPRPRCGMSKGGPAYISRTA
jgi:hypothetical protein